MIVRTAIEEVKLLAKHSDLYPIEIKAGKTITNDYFKSFQFWKKITGFENGAVIYAGLDAQKRSNGIQVISWKDFHLSSVT